ncbi:type III secretion apparatus protein%2C HrpE/YscL family [Yersinia intermedia]|uniref:Type III secretion apparatus protein, HrpE/YscL family n=1 Tax=Yersinia intermedia TaxID=631 RepID=A0A0H5M049_YERIN|nr:type III secretion system stator protein SctL [Yersinia intermedia]CRY56829.1 type III secretion apparatus protein%2C HrpE/YscL family [Yersinia intermedia]
MNPFYITVTPFDEPLPVGTIIPAGLLREMSQSRDLLSDARAQAAEILQAANAEKIQLLALAEQQAERLIEQTKNQMELDILAHHINWLVSEEQLMSSLVNQAQQRILAAITTVITEWAGQQAADKILIHHLASQVTRLAEHNNLVLRVNPQHLPAVIVALGARIRCISDETLAEDEAQLSSPQLQLSFSLHRHLSQLLLWLQASSLPAKESMHDQDK